MVLARVFFFIASILLNNTGKYTLSSIILIINTNYCVLFFSTYLGLNSGIHLYLYTSPLIVLLAFDTKDVKVIALSMSSYVITYFLILLGSKIVNGTVVSLSESTLTTLYIFNFSCSLLILIILSSYFFYNNNKINTLLHIRNKELSERQKDLNLENKIRKVAEMNATEALAEREILLSEIHHRVKNNLAVVSGLLDIHTLHLTDETVLNVIRESQTRIKSIAILHEKLYENKSLKEVDFNAYVVQLISFLSGNSRLTEKQIEFKINIGSINVDMKQAMPLGLLINELISNSNKHAFKDDKQGLISIEMLKANGNYQLNYKDNGIGFDYLPDAQRASLGLTLIETFSNQLNGNYKFERTQGGMLFEINFK